MRERERRRGEGRAPTADRHARAHLNPTPSPPRYKEEAGEHKKYVIPIDDFNCGRQGLNNVNSLILVNGDGGSETALCLDHIEIIGGGPFQSQPQIPAMPEGGGAAAGVGAPRAAAGVRVKKRRRGAACRPRLVSEDVFRGASADPEPPF